MDYNRRQIVKRVPFHRTPVGIGLIIVVLLIFTMFAWLNWKPRHHFVPNAPTVSDSRTPTAEKS